MMRDRDAIDQLTSRLRDSTDPLWERLRVLLRERAVDPGKSLLVEFFLDDGNLYFGIVVTPQKRAFQFDFDLVSGDASEAILSMWQDITGAPQSPHAGIAEAGIFRLEEEGGVIPREAPNDRSIS